MGYRLLRYVCIRNESEGENTTAQVPTSLNGCSGMKGGGERREGKMAGQVCVTGGRGGRRWWWGGHKDPLLIFWYSVIYNRPFISPTACVSRVKWGENPFSPQGGADDGGVGSVEQGDPVLLTGAFMHTHRHTHTHTETHTH